jgi:hypothetical protein
MRDQQNLELGSCECRNDEFHIPWGSKSNASISSHTLLAVIINGTSLRSLGMYSLSSASFSVTHKQTHFRFFAEGFAGASFNASFIGGLTVMVYLWPIQFNIWKASMSLRNLCLQISAPHQASGHEPDAGHPFHRAKKLGCILLV